MIKIIGGGLAGTEAAYQLLRRGMSVRLYEMRPIKNTPAHNSSRLAELVCSNSLKSALIDTSSGLLKEEMRRLDSLVLEAGEAAAIPAGSALAVDKEIFSEYITNKLNSFPRFELITEETDALDINEYTIVATGPLTSDKLSFEIQKLTGREHLHFYDAVAPIVSFDSINFNNAFLGSRYNKGGDDYINCPMNKTEYDVFYNELIKAQRVELKEFEKGDVFESCMPIEVMAERGYDAIRYGPLRPVGIRHPLTNQNYFAVVQLRKENKWGTMYNIVGFQTNLTFSEQKRVFNLIPALKNAEYERYGVMHRNTYINSPDFLCGNFRFKDSKLFFAGQLTGVEGYMESAASGLLASIGLYRDYVGLPMVLPPEDTLLGALSRHISTPSVSYQPMNANFGLLPSVSCRDKSERKKMYSNRSLSSINDYIAEVNNK